MSLTTDAHSFKPGDVVRVKEWKLQPLKTFWRGPFTVILSIPTAVKVAETVPWSYSGRIKPAA